jgi:Tfp pilus assembly protein PilF
LQPDLVEACRNLGDVLRDQGLSDRALGCYRRALQLRPDHAETYNECGALLGGRAELADAVACFRRALELKPDYPEALNNLGIVFRRQGHLDEAVACYRRALELGPDYAQVYNNLGGALAQQTRYAEAIACYQRAIALKADYAEAHFHLSLVQLLLGDFDRAWPEYQWRWKMKAFARPPFRRPLWDGRPLRGQTILLQTEQGFGDTIQFIRYAPLLKLQGARVVVQCQEALRPLLASCPGIDALIGTNDPLPEFDVHAPLLGVPGILKTTLESIPATVPYLSASPVLVQRWREELERIEGLKVGIAWQGSPTFVADRSPGEPADGGRSRPVGRSGGSLGDRRLWRRGGRSDRSLHGYGCPRLAARPGDHFRHGGGSLGRCVRRSGLGCPLFATRLAVAAGPQ